MAVAVTAMPASDEHELVLLSRKAVGLAHSKMGWTHKVPAVSAQSERPRACLRAPGVHTDHLSQASSQCSTEPVLGSSDQAASNN